MKQLLQIFAVISCFILTDFAGSAIASHAAGAEMYYECLGGNTYQVTYVLYRDCMGIPAPNNVVVEIRNQCGLPYQTDTLRMSTWSPIDVPTTCPTVPTACIGGVYLGIESYEYTGTIELSGPCSLWEIGYAETSRANSITTTTNGGTDQLYVSCMINNSSGICNSSPYFDRETQLQFCVGQRMSIIPLVSENDGDSLSFELIRPRTGPLITDTVTYLNGYSYLQPVYCSSGLLFNPQNGSLSGIPAVSDFSIYAIAVNEYRNGVWIGSVEKDMMVEVNNCVNIIPITTGFNGTASTTMNVIAGVQNCFYAYSFDPDAGNQTRIDYDYSIPGMNFSTSGSQRDTAYFCWNPSLGDTSSNPHCFTLSVTDGNCPVPGHSITSYCLNVVNIVGVENIEENQIHVWPNPVFEDLNLNTSFTGKVEVTLFDTQGRQIVSSVIPDANGIVRLNQVESGVYLLLIKNLKNGQNYFKRIIKE